MKTINAMQLKAVIRNKAKEEGVPSQLVMQNYLLERLLERISLSSWRDSVVIKGGVLISSLLGMDKRSTLDLDTTVRGFPLTHENVEKAFRKIASVQVEDDFSFEFVRSEDIREADDYSGIRVHLLASYEKMNSAVTVDVTTGDKITPGAIEYNYPLMFEDRLIPLMAYPLTTILAEKLETVISRGVANTRSRDYYDLHTLWRTRKAEIDLAVLKEALVATSEKRGTFDVMSRYREVMAEVAADIGMLDRWASYAQRYSYVGDTTLQETCETVIAIMDAQDGCAGL